MIVMNLPIIDNTSRDEEKARPVLSHQPISSQALFTSRKRRLPANYVPGEYTILCGRGKACFNSSGNRHLKSLVKKSLTSYSESQNKVHKSSIVSEIIAEIKKLSPEAAFVKHEEGSWWELDDNFAREKIGCLFRDCLFTQYRSSTKAKQARKKKMNSMAASGGHHSHHHAGGPLGFDSGAFRRSQSNFDPRELSASLGLPIGNAASPLGRAFPSSRGMQPQSAEGRNNIDPFAPIPLPSAKHGEHDLGLSSSRFAFPSAKSLEGHQMPFRRGDMSSFTRSFLPRSLSSSPEEAKSGSNLNYSSGSVLQRAYAVISSDNDTRHTAQGSASSRAFGGGVPNAAAAGNGAPDDIANLFQTDDLPDSFEDPFQDEL